MKLSTIKAIKSALTERKDVTVEKIKVGDMVNKITAFRDKNEIVFVKENYNGGTYTTFDLTDDKVDVKLKEFSKLNNFSKEYVL